MMRKFACVAMIGCLLVAATPVLGWARSNDDGHDCVKAGKRGYKCVKGPLAGKSFPTQEAMIKEMRKGASFSTGSTPPTSSAKKSKVAVKKSRRK